jgi:hypothetical protein
MCLSIADANTCCLLHRQEDVCGVSESLLENGCLVHHGHRSAESIEYRKARLFCYKNSKFDPKLQERVFEGSEEDMRFLWRRYILKFALKILLGVLKGWFWRKIVCGERFSDG